MNRIRFGIVAAILAICTAAVAAPKNNIGDKDIVDTAVAAGSTERKSWCENDTKGPE